MSCKFAKIIWQTSIADFFFLYLFHVPYWITLIMQNQTTRSLAKCCIVCSSGLCVSLQPLQFSLNPLSASGLSSLLTKDRGPLNLSCTWNSLVVEGSTVFLLFLFFIMTVNILLISFSPHSKYFSVKRVTQCVSQHWWKYSKQKDGV